MRGNQPNLLVASCEVFAAFDRFDFLRGTLTAAVMRPSGNAYGSPAISDQQRAWNRKRQRQLQLEMGALTGA